MNTIQTTAPQQSVPVTALQRSLIADPTPIATGILGFQLLIYVGRWISVGPTTLADSPLTAAANISILIAGIAQVSAAVLSLVRGNAYVGYVSGTFGLWLVGFYLLATSKAPDPDAFAWYLGALIIPLLLIMIPAVMRRRWSFIVAFGAIVVLLILDTAAFHILHTRIAEATANKTPPDLSTTVNLLRASGWAALVAALTLFWIMGRAVLEGTGILTANDSHL